MRRSLRRSENAALFAAMAIAALLVLLAISGCAASQITNARNAVATAAGVQAEASKAFVAFDLVHQRELVDAAPTKQAADAALAAYRAKRAKAVTAFQATWLATVAAETAINLVEAGQKAPKDLMGYVTALLATVGQLTGALQALGVPIPSL